MLVHVAQLQPGTVISYCTHGKLRAGAVTGGSAALACHGCRAGQDLALLPAM